MRAPTPTTTRRTAAAVTGTPAVAGTPAPAGTVPGRREVHTVAGCYFLASSAARGLRPALSGVRLSLPTAECANGRAPGRMSGALEFFSKAGAVAAVTAALLAALRAPTRRSLRSRRSR